MGNIDNREMLVARWAQLVDDASLRDLPYKVELNAEGTIEMSPASNSGMRQYRATWRISCASRCPKASSIRSAPS